MTEEGQASASGSLPLMVAGHIDRVCDRYEADWRAGRKPRIEDYLNDIPEPDRPALLRELLMLEIEFRKRGGELPTPEEYQARFSGHEALIGTIFEAEARGPEPATHPQSLDDADADRNLLLGLLAVLLDFIGPDTLDAAMQAWDLDKTRTLGQILRERGALTADGLAQLESLVAEHLRGHVDKAGLAGAVRENLSRIADPDLRARLDRVRTLPAENDPCATQTLVGKDTPALTGVPTSAGLRYQILRPHARGGLGTVFVARDEELHREVALKELQDHLADSPRARARFLLEAEITGGLEHPGIVPVYGLGQYGDGRPYYAMRFIRGESLQTAIDRFHAAESPDRDPGERAVELRHLLGRFLDVCNTIAYAHSRGVLHRDIKPANIMLGKYGEAMVVDWGLAKTGDRPEPGGPSAEQPLSPKAASGMAETLPGSTIGTPAYMSPEQAAGQLDRLGNASDVYSLGATLYNLLTGRAPFEDRDVSKVLQQVQRGEFPPPRKVNATVHPALEAICLKAMALRPEDRYASLRALTDDLEHWLADEPVAVYPEPWTRRAWRWMRRHRTLVTGTVALLATAVAALAVGTAFIDAARRSEVLARKAETEAKQREKGQRLIAEGARKQAEAELYLSNVALAGREWLAGNSARVEDLLNRCPPDRRLWEWFFLKRQGDAGLHTLVGPHVGLVTAVAFSPDGARLASAGWHATAKVWDPEKGSVVLDLDGPDGHVGHILALVYSPDGKRIATAGNDGTARLWDALTGRAGPVLRGHEGPVAAVAFSPDGARLATGGRDHLVKLWDPATGEEVTTLRGHEGGVTALAYSPDGRLLASAGELPDTAVRLWDTATDRETKALPGHVINVNALTFRPDGRHLASASNDGIVWLWDVEAGQPRGFLATEGRWMIKAVAYSPDGKTVATGGLDQMVRLWDAEKCQELFVVRGHVAGVMCLAFRPDGQVLASGSEDGVVKLWDAAAGPEAVRAAVADAHHAALAYSSDGRWVASATTAKEINPIGAEVRLWEVATGRAGPVLREHDDDVIDLAFDPVGARLAALGSRGVVTVWELSSSRKLRALQGPAGKARGAGRPRVAFGPGGRTLACVDKTGAVAVWDPATGREVRSFHISSPNPQGIGHSAMAFSPDGRRLALAELDGAVHLWDVADGREVAVLRRGRTAIFAIAFSPDGRLLAAAEARESSASASVEIKVWDVAAGREVVTFAGPTGGTEDLAFSPDGRRLASTGPYQGAMLWDVESGRELLTLPVDGRTGLSGGGAGPGSRVAFSPDGTRLALVGLGGVMIWNATAGPEMLTLRAPVEVFGLAYSPDGMRLAIADGQDAVVIREAATGRALLTLAEPDQPSGVSLFDVRFSPDGRRLAVASAIRSSGKVSLWNAVTGRLEGSLEGHAGPVLNVAFSPDGRRLATASHDKTAKVWDIATRRALWTLGAHTDRVNGVAFSPDGRLLATASRDGSVKLWDPATGRELRTLRGHKGSVIGLAFSPDGRRLASSGGRGLGSTLGSPLGEVKLWDAATGREVLSFPEYPRFFFSVAFSPDGRSLAAASDDRVVRVWDAATGRERLALRGHHGPVKRVAFSPDGRFLASSSEDRTVRVWDLTHPAGPSGREPAGGVAGKSDQGAGAAR